jgi:hypothetical protein
MRRVARQLELAHAPEGGLVAHLRLKRANVQVAPQASARAVWNVAPAASQASTNR